MSTTILEVDPITEEHIDNSPDTELILAITRRLQSHGQFSGAINVVRQGVFLIASGEVSTYFGKQLVNDALIEEAFAGEQIRNDVVVK